MKFQELYTEITQSTEIIRAMLTGINQGDAQLKKNKKEWSILEVTCHLYDTEREDFREHLDFILHRQDDGEWSAIDPQAWVTERKYNQQDFNKVKGKFFRERERSLVWLKRLKNANWNIKYTSQWGSMPAGEMFASWVAHDNLHIRQLTELRRRLIEQKTKPYKIGYAGDW
jgi:hypothetical protein